MCVASSSRKSRPSRQNSHAGNDADVNFASMPTPFVAALGGWHNFYILLGTSAATLIGLMFVAVSFGASLVSLESSSATRAFLDPTVSHFVQVLLTSALVLVPTVDAGVFGGILLAVGTIRVLALVVVYRGLRHAHRKSGDLELSDWMSGIVIPLSVYVGLLYCGGSTLAGEAPLGVLAIVTVAALLNGIYGAWELMLWLAMTRVRSRAGGDSSSAG